LLKQESLPTTFTSIVDELRREALATAANQLIQRKVLLDAKDAFTEASIDYLVFKGVNLRYTIYDDPTHRPVCDIDILVRKEHKLDAVKALVDAGFTAVHKAENISHETSLHKKTVWIDLHWHLMRPGRTRIDLNDYLFGQQKAFEGFEGLNNEASLLVMLIHPAITKYVNGSASSLRHLVDIHRLAQCDDIDWNRLLNILSTSGTRTAAWASLMWLQMLADRPVHDQLSDQLRPGSMKAGWLQFWVGNNLNLKLADRRLIIRCCFSLMLQDSLIDAFRAVRSLRDERSNVSKILKSLQQLK